MIAVAGVRIQAHPEKVDVGRFNLSKSNRTASGHMNMELIRTGVRRVDVNWRYLPDPQLLTLLRALENAQMTGPFFDLRYPDAGGEKNMLCYVGDIHTGLWHTFNGVRYWDEVSIAFIEK